MIWVLGGFILLVVAYIAAWQWDLLPREVIATGTIETPGGKTLKTRQFYRTTGESPYKSPAPGPTRKVAAWEVQLPSGRWVDCDGEDCLAAYERMLK